MIAVDEDTAQDALDQIEVEYEPLPAVVWPDEAVSIDAPIIHDTIAKREFLTFPDLVLNESNAKNVLNYYRLRKGSIEDGFAEADEVFEGTFRTPHEQHCSLSHTSPSPESMAIA